ncbi:MAG: hypothetical protein ACRDSH_07200, partial [Pseudonocardiaceae bacterium]
MLSWACTTPNPQEVSMSTRTEPWPSGTPCWVDLAVPDVEAATKFYGAILGWTYSDTGEEF